MKLADKEKCTGCMACVDACAKESITIQIDNLGNNYPVINGSICVSCKKCEKVCPALYYENFTSIRNAYAVWSLNSENRKSSASGGAATEFYRQAIEEKYWICGTEYQNDFQVKHVLSKNAESIINFKQSKYVYSESKGIFKEIKRLLKSGEKVLFISLPCKVAALLRYLEEVYPKLVTVDIICHGTPPYQNLKEHIDEKSMLQMVNILRFREDNEFKFVLKENDRIIYQKIGRTDTYLAAFLEGLNYRESCYNCKYACSERVSDITIGDFWGLGQEVPFEHPYTGSISVVLINSETGACFFEKCRKNLFVEERPVSEAIKGNAQLNSPTPMHPKRELYEKTYGEDGFEKAVLACLKSEIKAEQKKIRKIHIRNDIKKIVGLFVK